MLNTNHKLQKYENDYNQTCLKCNYSFANLFYKAKAIRKIKEMEIAINYVNEVYPCITDEEAVIKNLLE